MLKIAEYNTITGEKIDLKELEKYGFIQKPMIYIKEIKRDNGFLQEEKIIYIEEANREISIKNGLFNIDEELDTIYDLTKGGLVEKVKE